LAGKRGYHEGSPPEALLNTPFRVSVFAALWLSGCIGEEPASAPTATQSSAIQDGTTDSTDTFSVGIIQTEDISQDMVSYCTGVMLGPNLVATARHCVSELSSSTIECGTSSFGALYPASDLFITTSTVIDPHDLTSYNNSVSEILVPSGSGSAAVCGNDIALLILGQPITLPQYVVPTISPAMTSSQYETTVTAIGYGVDSPTDTTGSTAGTRRIKENVALQCIPNDPNPSESALDCFASDPTQAPMYLTASEFMSGDSTCEGDSGSGAFEQSNFDAGRWVAFGVLSRGGTSADGTTCIQPIYSRFDAWTSLLVSAANEAATMGGYAVPSWAINVDAGLGQFSSGADSSAASGSDGGASAGDDDSSTATGAPATGSSADGTSCDTGSACASGLCATTTGSTTGPGVCVALCGAGNTCASDFTCQSGYCFPASSPTHGSSGCSVAGSPGAPSPASALVWGVGLAGLGMGRGRRRRRDLSAS
jgi:MYXO-CTERM domain-containing protein